MNFTEKGSRWRDPTRLLLAVKLKSFRLQIHTYQQMTQLDLENKLSALCCFVRACTCASRVRASPSTRQKQPAP